MESWTCSGERERVREREREREREIEREREKQAEKKEGSRGGRLGGQTDIKEKRALVGAIQDALRQSMEVDWIAAVDIIC